MAVLATAASLSQKWEPGRIQLSHAAAEAAAAQEGIGMSTDSIILFLLIDFFIFVYLARRVVCPRFLALRPILQRSGRVKIRKDGNVNEFIAISSASTPAEAVVEQFEPWQLAAVAAAEGSVGG